jgi:hypothetical protein
MPEAFSIHNVYTLDTCVEHAEVYDAFIDIR